ITCLFVLETTGLERQVPTAGLAQVVKDRSTNASPGTIVHDEREETFGAFPGIRFEIDGKVMNNDAHRAVWVSSWHGYCYQIHVLGPKLLADDINKTLSDFCDRIQPIDGERVEHSAGFEPIADFESKRFGYRVELGGTEWAALKSFNAETASVEFLTQY